MSLDGLQLALYFTPAYPVERAVSMARALMKAMGKFRGHGPEPLEPSAHLVKADRDEAFEGGYGMLALQYPALGDFRTVTIMHADEGPWAKLQASVSLMQETRDDVALAWELMSTIAPRAVAELKPSLAFVGPLADIPKMKTLAPKRLPKTFTAWTFIGGDALDAANKRALEGLPDAQAVRAHAGGLVVQAVPDLYAAPSRAFVAALKTLPAGGATYKQSRATA